ncbi:MAG: RND transporter [Verrucomicrobiales bacterium]|nr:RND transporter [Verrucomicrobiales bacterium]|tara:strand:- start:1917 stop:4226 length:2310 start_codon:yes stop_codon:yes gene_type:complete
MIKSSFSFWVEQWLFRHRARFLVLFLILTALFLGFATQTQVDARFEKQLPLGHEYIQKFREYESEFGGANRVILAMIVEEGEIFNEDYFNRLDSLTKDVYAMSGVDQASVTSLFTPNVRFTEVVEDGFTGGNVVPADFANTLQDLAKVKENVLKSNYMGRLVTDSFNGAMVMANLLDIDPDTKKPLDTFAVARALESLRGKYESETIKVHVIGFAKVMGDVRDGALNVIFFFCVTIVVTALLVWLYSQSFIFSVLPMGCSLAAVAWQLGIIHLMGFGIDPMSILVPFLVFAIGVSHGVQMVRVFRDQLFHGEEALIAARKAFSELLIPGGVALLTDTIGFITILLIPVPTIRELAIAASVGVAAIIVTNLILLPLLLSYQKPSHTYRERVAKRKIKTKKFWHHVSVVSERRVAKVLAIIGILLFVFAFDQATRVEVGDLHAGVPELRSDSRYNQDTAAITDNFNLGVDVLIAFVETVKDGSVDYKVMELLDRFEWNLKNIEGVKSVLGLAGMARKINSGYSEGSLKWQVLPFNRDMLAQSVGRVETSTGLTNLDGSVLPVMIFLEDHKAETIRRIVTAVKSFEADYGYEKMHFSLAGGNAGIMAASNEVVRNAQFPILIYVFLAVILLCFASFRSIKIVICIVLPLALVSVLAHTLMFWMEIGLKTSTLPVVALGVGEGVDYGIYLFSCFVAQRRKGVAFADAMEAAMQQAGSAIVFTGLTLSVGVGTWAFSALQIQSDMGILLMFMFLMNMVCAIVLLPAIARLLFRS